MKRLVFLNQHPTKCYRCILHAYFLGQGIGLYSKLLVAESNFPLVDFARRDPNISQFGLAQRP